MSIASQHTPGEWTVSGPSKVLAGISDGGDYAVLDADGEIIAEAIAKVGVNNYRPAEANARLIAASPDLLEAAKLALNFIANTEGEQGITLDSGEALRAAIAKAVSQ